MLRWEGNQRREAPYPRTRFPIGRPIESPPPGTVTSRGGLTVGDAFALEERDFGGAGGGRNGPIRGPLVDVTARPPGRRRCSAPSTHVKSPI